MQGLNSCNLSPNRFADGLCTTPWSGNSSMELESAAFSCEGSFHPLFLTCPQLCHLFPLFTPIISATKMYSGVPLLDRITITSGICVISGSSQHSENASAFFKLENISAYYHTECLIRILGKRNNGYLVDAEEKLL